MIISVDALAWLIGTATLLTAAAPAVLLILWLKDWFKGHLW